MDYIALTIFGMATWRISSLLVREQGPWGMFVWIRERVGIQHDDKGKPWLIPDNTLAGILSCVWCCSVYIGFFWLALYYLFPSVAVFIGTGFCLSAVAIFFDKYCMESIV